MAIWIGRTARPSLRSCLPSGLCALTEATSRKSGSPHRPGRRVLRALSAAAMIMACLTCLAGAPMAQAGEVSGEIKWNPKNLGSPPARNQGFLERVENPLRAIKPFDPHPYMVAVLDGGPLDDAAKQPAAGPVQYKLVGESFAEPLLPVVVGTRIEIVNRGPREVVLLTPDEPELLDAVTIKPKSYHEIKVTKAETTIVVKAQDSVHLEGRIVALPHRYFALVDSRGRFSFASVPEGTWKVRIWYRDRWLEGVEASVEVGKRSADVTLTLSPNQVRATPAK